MNRALYTFVVLPLAACLFPALDGLGTDGGADNDASADATTDALGGDVITNPDAMNDGAVEAQPIVIVQSVGMNVFGQPANVKVMMPSPQVKGHLTIVSVSWQSGGSVSTITDTDGNTYQVAVPSTSSVDLGHAIYYAKNIKGGSTPNVITVTPVDSSSDGGADDPNVAVVELSGLDTAAPFEKMNQANANSAMMSSGNVITTSARSILIASAVLDYGASFADAGLSFTPIPLSGSRAGDIIGYQIVQTAGTYSATITLAGSTYWMLQLAAFK